MGFTCKGGKPTGLTQHSVFTACLALMALLGIAACIVVYVGVNASIVADAGAEFSNKLGPAPEVLRGVFESRLLALRSLTDALDVAGGLPERDKFQQVRVSA